LSQYVFRSEVVVCRYHVLPHQINRLERDRNHEIRICGPTISPQNGFLSLSIIVHSPQHLSLQSSTISQLQLLASTSPSTQLGSLPSVLPKSLQNSHWLPFHHSSRSRSCPATAPSPAPQSLLGLRPCYLPLFPRPNLLKHICFPEPPQASCAYSLRSENGNDHGYCDRHCYRKPRRSSS
jgi:hypothetical protein